MTKLLACLAFLPLVGCHTQSIDERADRRIAEARTDTEYRVRYSKCTDGSAIGPGCGLILAHVTTDGFRDRFQATRCVNRTEEECQTLYQRAVDAWLLQRYSAADRQAVALECDSHPGMCHDPVAYERTLLASHNDRIWNDLANHETEIDAQRKADHQRDEADTAATIGTTIAATDAILTLLLRSRHRSHRH